MLVIWLSTKFNSLVECFPFVNEPLHFPFLGSKINNQVKDADVERIAPDPW